MSSALTLHEKCRICGNVHLEEVVNLSSQPISSIFPLPSEPDPTSTPLELVRCSSTQNHPGCGLLQLRHTASLEEMYGTSYGYYSSLSTSMIDHLQAKVVDLLKISNSPHQANILDIGCNDGTLLNSYVNVAKRSDLKLYGVDPSSEKYRSSFHNSINLDVSFFDASFKFRNPDISFHIITSIAMFYDIDDPISFTESIASILHPDGVWALELSYLPLFLKQLSYDQICHEHVTYYSLRDLVSLLERCNLSIFKVQLNDMNGGSIYLMCCHTSRLDKYSNAEDALYIDDLLAKETVLTKSITYESFTWRLSNHQDEIRQFFEYCKRASSKVYGYGASTKGNILAHFCNITTSDLPLIGDLNPEKHGRVTPGTRIPIVSHEFIKSRNPEYLFVFIWHFRKEVIELEMDFIKNGGRLVFPLPRLHIVDKENVHLFRGRSFSLQAFDL